MSLARWSPNLSVGIEAIDADHQQLIVLVNRLGVAVARGADREEVVRNLNELIAHTERHFDRESELMSRYNYPEAEHHRSIHQELLADIAELQKEFDQGAEIGSEFVLYVWNWVLSHIVEDDKPLGDYLKACTSGQPDSQFP
jgi:hemerythrin